MDITLDLLIAGSPLASRLLQPVLDLFDQGLCSTKSAPKSGVELTDTVFTVFGVLRALLEFKSGRHALQNLPASLDWVSGFLPRATWFHALANPKRLECLKATEKQLRQALDARLPDSLARFPELDAFDVFLGDGHWHGAAHHDAKEPATPTSDPKALPVGHLYFANHRNRLMRPHVKCAPGTQEHDMSALARAPLHFLRAQREAGGRKQSLVIYDRAAINHAYWNKAKQSSGIYLLTRFFARASIGERSPWKRPGRTTKR
jgi:hypothetical protein